MKILAFAASLRKDSFNRKLIQQAVELMKKNQGIEIVLMDYREFEMPIYDGDVEESSGIPSGGKKFIQCIEEADAIVISTPEYNGGIPGTLKNAIDWASRAEKMPFAKKRILLMGASPGALGAVRGLWHTRVPLEACGAFVYPEMFGLPKADQAFHEDGSFVDPKNASRLEKLLTSFISFKF